MVIHGISCDIISCALKRHKLKMDSKVLKNFHILRVQEIRDKSAKVEKSYGVSLYIT